MKPIPYWKVGLVAAPALSGPWKRLSDRNPVPLDARYGVENPIVTRLQDGRYIAVFDTLGLPDRIGYVLSRDGLEWSRAQYLVLDKARLWTKDLRTPLGSSPRGTVRSRSSIPVSSISQVTGRMAGSGG